MTPTPRAHPVGCTLEPQESLSFEDVACLQACLLRTSSENEKMLFSENSPSSDDMIPRSVDILCGKGREAHVHTGNKRFRVIISQYRKDYQNARCRDQKTRITKEIVSSIRECGGRFLKKDQNTDIWYDVGDEYAHEKVSHALRSARDPTKKIPKIRNPKVAQHQPPTPEENHAFWTLVENQKRIFRSLLEQDKASNYLDFEEDEHWVESFLSDEDEYYSGGISE